MGPLFQHSLGRTDLCSARANYSAFSKHTLHFPPLLACVYWKPYSPSQVGLLCPCLQWHYRLRSSSVLCFSPVLPTTLFVPGLVGVLSSWWALNVELFSLPLASQSREYTLVGFNPVSPICLVCFANTVLFLMCDFNFYQLVTQEI